MQEKLKKGLLCLIDPDKEIKFLKEMVKKISDAGASAILLGGSTYGEVDFDEFVKEVKRYSEIPVIIFPSGMHHISKYADAIFFMSLLSGRNPQYLIEEQVKAAPLIKKYGLEVIPVGYILVDGGNPTSASYISHTMPIPRDKPRIAKYHALTAQYFGMKYVYLDAGSGAKYSVPEEMIKEVKEYIDIPLIVGGGIKTPEEALKKRKAGADFIVVGNIIEKDINLVYEFVKVLEKEG